jgi:DnaJ-domain-containing protein 1
MLSSMEILAILGGLIFGYIAISLVINLDQKARSKTPEEEKHISSNWFNILEASENALLPEITIQYKRKISEYHPDKVASLGRELKELAELKSKEINNAYEYAKSIKT